MSRPRLGFLDNAECAYKVCHQLFIPLTTTESWDWKVGIQETVEHAIDNGAEIVLTLDYDSYFTSAHVAALLHLLESSDADAIAPVQCARGINPRPMFTMLRDGVPTNELTEEEMQQDLVKVQTAHFGLTLLKVAAFEGLEKPWFHSMPGPDGGYRQGRVDPDVYFWNQWADLGRSLYLAPKIGIGHMQQMCTFPGPDLYGVHRSMEEAMRT